MNQELKTNPSPSPNHNLPKRKSSDAARVLTALIGIPIVLWIVWSGGRLFFFAVMALMALALIELEFAASKSRTPLITRVYLLPILVLMFSDGEYARGGADAIVQPSSLLLILCLLPVALLVAGVLAYGKRRKISLASLALTQLAIMYVGLFAFFILLRDLANIGLQLFWIVLAGTWSGDTAAYFFGRKFGRRPLTPLSPGKTREGFGAGVFASLLVCVLLARYFEFDLRHGIAIGVLIALAAPLGDLVESFWKRELGVKDLGKVLPGHGGVLDRCDSLLFAAFAVYLYAVWQLQ